MQALDHYSVRILLSAGLPIFPVVIGVASRHDDDYGVRNDEGALI